MVVSGEASGVEERADFSGPSSLVLGNVSHGELYTDQLYQTESSFPIYDVFFFDRSKMSR